MSDMYYNIHIREAVPTRPITGWFWIKPSQGQAFIYIIDGWKPIAGSDAIVNTYEDSYYRKIIQQEAVPTGTNDVLGQIWLKTSENQAYIKLSDWISFAGG